MDAQARKPSALVPIRVEFETDTHRIRDCFVWNLHEDLIRPESFARTFCMDLDLPLVPWQETVANQIRAQLEDFEGVASMDLGEDYYLMMDDPNAPGVAEGTVQPVQPSEEIPECRVILSVSPYYLLRHLVYLGHDVDFFSSFISD